MPYKKIDLFIGIDVSQAKNDIVILGEDGNILKQLSIIQNIEGIKQLKETIRTLHHKTIHFACEATSVYSMKLMDHICEAFKQYNARFYQLPGYTIKRFKDLLGKDVKNDSFDALAIAKFIKSFHEETDEYRKDQFYLMKRLVRQHATYTKYMIKLKMAIYRCIFIKLSELMVDKDNGDFNLRKKSEDNILVRVLTELPNTTLATIRENEIRFIVEESHKNITKEQVDKIVKYFVKAQKLSYRLDTLQDNMITYQIASLYVMLRTYEMQKLTLEVYIRQIILGIHPTAYMILLSIPGIGAVVAAQLLSEIVDVNNFKDEKALAKYAGLTWPEIQSGTTSKPRHISYRCNRWLRFYICRATLYLVQQSSIFREYFEKKKKEVAVNASKRALLLTARKAVRMIFTLLKNNKLFNHSSLHMGQLHGEGFIAKKKTKTLPRQIQVTIDDLLTKQQEELTRLREKCLELRHSIKKGSKHDNIHRMLTDKMFAYLENQDELKKLLEDLKPDEPEPKTPAQLAQSAATKKMMAKRKEMKEKGIEPPPKEVEYNKTTGRPKIKISHKPTRRN